MSENSRRMGEPSGTGYSSETTPSGRGAAREYPSRKWLPIETAPKDRSVVLLAAVYPDTSVWSDPRCGWWDGLNWTRWPHDFRPTHWAPIPALPALGTEARSAETGTGSVEDEGPACKATPKSPSPLPDDKTAGMTVEEATNAP